MPKFISFKKGLLSVLFWSIISAAFIGPGTITTAGKAGASYSISLAWALIFAVIATIVLQEAAARITIASGKNLGEFIAAKYPSGKSIPIILFLAVAFGCAAYEAGNMLGSVSGLLLLYDLPIKPFFIIIGLVCALFLWLGNIRTIANALGVVVALMGIVFIVSAFNTEIPIKGGLESRYMPSIPFNSSLLILGLIGTTIVPYNLFLASGISKGQSISEMRWGITIAIIIGGIISLAILIVGTQVSGSFSFEELGETLSRKSNPMIKSFFGFGLFAAGLSSAITAPLAAAITGQSLLGNGRPSWGSKSKNFRLVWATVLAIGITVGLVNVPIIPAIILAQAINAFLLPLIAVFLFFAVNDKSLLPSEYINRWYSNVLMLLIVCVAIYLGLTNLYSAIQKAYPDVYIGHISTIKLVISLLVVGFCGFYAFKKN